MDEFELLVMTGSAYLTYVFFRFWYQPVLNAWPPFRGRLNRTVTGLLPVAAFFIMFITLLFYSAISVKTSLLFIVFYLLLGFACLLPLVGGMGYLLDISIKDDVLNLNNTAALFPACGGMLALTLIYSGANVGEGPGFWCVLVAGGMGCGAWFLLSMLSNRFTNVSEQITIERDLGCGLRFGGYLLGSGIILARASAGDWTSFDMTLREFTAGWPVLGLTAIVILTELVFAKTKNKRPAGTLTSAALLGLAYIAYGVAAVMLLPPLRQNPFYH